MFCVYLQQDTTNNIIHKYIEGMRAQNPQAPEQRQNEDKPRKRKDRKKKQRADKAANRAQASRQDNHPNEEPESSRPGTALTDDLGQLDLTSPQHFPDLK